VSKKVSIVLDEELRKQIEDFRVQRYRERGVIPKMAEAIIELIREGLARRREVEHEG